jgi:phage-related baseplate assembly protein
MPETANMEDLQNFLTPDHVDLSALPAPAIIEELDFEAIFQALLADFRTRCPAYDALLESDPVIVALQCAAYRELLLRHRINEAAKANMLAYATGADLDNLAAFYGTERQENESDDRLRYRAQLALESLSTAGSEKAYLFHALSASPLVKSASVQTPNAGEVLITILSTEGDGTADEDLISAVADYVSAEDKRPLTDNVVVQSAEIIPFSVSAQIFAYPGPSVSITAEEYQARLQKYLAKQHVLGGTIARSGIFNALHAEGVQKVVLTAPANDITTTKEQAAFCQSINLGVSIASE